MTVSIYILLNPASHTVWLPVLQATAINGCVTVDMRLAWQILYI